MSRSIVTPLYFFLSSLYIISLMISNTVGGKVFLFLGHPLPAAVLLFPIVYILDDVMTEVYGWKGARLVTWVAITANIIMVLYYWLVIKLPPASFWKGQEAYSTVLGLAPRIVLASITGYFWGSFTNSYVMSKLKKVTKGKYLFVRTISSTLAGQLVDTAIFITITFTGSVPNNALIHMIIAQYLFKVSYEAIMTPFTYLVVNTVKRIEKIDIYDYGVKYSVFAIFDLKYPLSCIKQLVKGG